MNLYHNIKKGNKKRLIVVILFHNKNLHQEEQIQPQIQQTGQNKSIMVHSKIHSVQQLRAILKLLKY